MKRNCQKNMWNSGGDGSHNSCFHFPLSALCRNPRTFYCRAFPLSPLSWIYNNDNYLPYVSFQLKSSRKIILLESPHQVHLSPPTYCQASQTQTIAKMRPVLEHVFSLYGLITSQFGVLQDDEKRKN